jgi:hypothetical protein
MKRFALTSLIMFELIGEIHYVLIEKIRIWQKKSNNNTQIRPQVHDGSCWILMSKDISAKIV